MEYYLAIKRIPFECVLMRWMKIQPVIQSEVSQKEKYKYHILMLGGIGGRRRRGRQRMRWLDRIINSMHMSLGELRELVMDRCTAIHGVEKSWTRLSD